MIKNKTIYFIWNHSATILKKIHKDIEWVWWNQCFNFDGKPKVPARGLDCGFILNNDFIYAEIKSSLHKDSYKTQIEKGIKKICELKMMDH